MLMDRFIQSGNFVSATGQGSQYGYHDKKDNGLTACGDNSRGINYRGVSLPIPVWAAFGLECGDPVSITYKGTTVNCILREKGPDEALDRIVDIPVAVWVDLGYYTIAQGAVNPEVVATVTVQFQSRKKKMTRRPRK